MVKVHQASHLRMAMQGPPSYHSIQTMGRERMEISACIDGDHIRLKASNISMMSTEYISLRLMLSFDEPVVANNNMPTVLNVKKS